MKGSIRLLHSADDDTDSTAKDDENGLNDSFDLNAFSPFSNFGGTIDDGDAMGDWNLFPGYYTSQDSYSLSLPPVDAAFKPNLNTTVNFHDTGFSIGTSVCIGAPLPNTLTMDEDANTMDTFIPSAWNDTHWDAFVDTEDIDTILKNATSLNAQRAVQMPDMTQLNNTSLNWNPRWDASVSFDSFPRSNTILHRNANIAGDSSAISKQCNLPSSNADTIGNYYSVGQGNSIFLNDFGNTIGGSRTALSTNESSFDLDGNAAWDLTDWTTIDWNTIDRSATDCTTIDWNSPAPDAPRDGYQDSNTNF